MPTDITYVGWERPFAVLAMGLLVVAAAAVAWRDPLPRRLAAPVLAALFAFLEFKQGFVRQGLGGTPAFFTLMLGAGIAVACRFPERLPRLPAGAAALALVGSLAAMALVALPRPSLLQALEPGDHATFLRQDLNALLSPAERDRLSAEGRRSMRSVYGLDRRTLHLLGDRPVHVEPWEIGVAWAYGLNWHPLPVIQGYSAYTPSLDRLNAEALSGSEGPALILRQNTLAFTERTTGSIDQRNLAWDPPAANLAMLCRYRTVRATGRWQLLERSAGHCGAPRPIGVVRTWTGRPIRVPAPPGPHEVVFARIEGVGVEGWERLRTFLYRARQRTVTLDGDRSWRIVPDTAADGLILRASAGADYPRPFQLAPDAHVL
jgi:hypothetical protein